MPNAPAKRVPSKKKRKRRCKRTVLWVDDDPNVSAAVARCLRRHSIRVIPAADGMQGYWLALTQRPDAIVTDLRMPRWEGQELVECLTQNEMTRNIPRIVLSGYASRLSPDYQAEKDLAAVLDKPVDMVRLLETLQACWPAPTAKHNAAPEDAA